MSAGAISSLGTMTEQSSKGFGAITSEEFVKVMITELTNQDPFEPQDSAALLEQMSSLRNIESQMELQESIGDLVSQNQFTMAGGLIGERVAGYDQAGGYVEGQVESVRVSDGEAVFVLTNGRTMAIDQIVRIGDLSAAETGATLESLMEKFASMHSGDSSLMTLADYGQWEQKWQENYVTDVEKAIAQVNATLNTIQENFGNFDESKDASISDGDYTGDGIVNEDDQAIFDEQLRKLTNPTFTDGDFDDNGVIDLNDKGVLDMVRQYELEVRNQQLANAEASGNEPYILSAQRELNRFKGMGS